MTEPKYVSKQHKIRLNSKVNLIERIINIKKKYFSTDLWKDEEAQQKKPPKPTKKLEQDNDMDNDNFLEATIIRPPIELPEIPVLNITSSAGKQGIMSTDWAEMIDVSQPVPEFREKIRDMAQTYPFELDNFQKQVSFTSYTI